MAAPVRAFVVAVVVACSLGLLTGCDLIGAFSDSSQHSGPIAAEVEAALGKKPTVFFAGKGQAMAVTMAFMEPPEATLPEIEKVARAAVVHELKDDPGMLMIQVMFLKLDKPS